MSEEPDPRWITAMTTEHFTMQTAAAATINEANSRASMYLMALSSTLVALGFTASHREVFPLLAGAMIPAVVVLGCFTIIRLVDTTIENMGYQTRILRIYEYYASIAPDGEHNFPIGPRMPNEAFTRYRIRHRFPFLTTVASTIGAINAIVGGAAVAYLSGTLLGLAVPVDVGVGVVVAVGLFALCIVYQHRRFAAADAHPVIDD